MQQRRGKIAPLRTEGDRTQIAVRLTTELAEAIAYCAEGEGLERSEWIRAKLAQAVQAEMHEEEERRRALLRAEERDDAESVAADREVPW